MSTSSEPGFDPFAHLIEIASEDKIPLGVQVDLTYRCDLNCVHCYQADRLRDELTFVEYQQFLADLAQLGGLYLVFSGGDIFVRPDALAILREAAEQRFDLSVITHAMSIDDQTADALKEIGVSFVYVSMYHSDPKIHDRVTRRPGSFERTISAIERMVKRDIRVVVKCTVFDLNQGAERVVPALAEALGAKCQLNCQLRRANDGTDGPLSLNLDLEGKANVYRCVLSKTTSLEDVSILTSDDQTCLAGHGSFYLSPDGTVQPCVDFPASAGNIRQTPLREIWESSPLLERVRAIRRGSFSACQTCDNVAFCGLCPALAYRETTIPAGKAPSACCESAAIRRSYELRRAEDEG